MPTDWTPEGIRAILGTSEAEPATPPPAADTESGYTSGGPPLPFSAGTQTIDQIERQFKMVQADDLERRRTLARQAREQAARDREQAQAAQS